MGVVAVVCLVWEAVDGFVVAAVAVDAAVDADVDVF